MFFKLFKIIILIFLLCIISIETTSISSKKILCLMSYSTNYPWTMALEGGFREYFEGLTDMYVEFQVEYLSVKFANTTERYSSNYVNFLHQRYPIPRDPHLLVAVDDYALNFIEDHYSELWEVPVVFIGINNRNSSTVPVYSTGVFETVQWMENLLLIRRLFPKVKDILYLYDMTPVGYVVSSQFKSLLPTLPQDVQDAFKVHYITEGLITFDEVIDALLDSKWNSETTVAIMAHYYTDVNNNFYTAKTGLQKMAEVTDYPVFVYFGSLILANASIGGCVISENKYSKEAAAMIESILRGEKVQDLPPHDAPLCDIILNEPVFYRYGLNKEDYPDVFEYLYHVPTFYELYLSTILVFVVVITIIGMVAGVAFILFYAQKKKTMENIRIKKSYAELLNKLPLYVDIFDKFGNLLNTNHYFSEEDASLLEKNILHYAQETVQDMDFNVIPDQFLPSFLNPTATSHTASFSHHNHSNHPNDEMVQIKKVKVVVENRIIQIHQFIMYWLDSRCLLQLALDVTEKESIMNFEEMMSETIGGLDYPCYMFDNRDRLIRVNVHGSRLLPENIELYIGLETFFKQFKLTAQYFVVKKKIEALKQKQICGVVDDLPIISTEGDSKFYAPKILVFNFYSSEIMCLLFIETTNVNNLLYCSNQHIKKLYSVYRFFDTQSEEIIKSGLLKVCSSILFNSQLIQSINPPLSAKEDHGQQYLHSFVVLNKVLEDVFVRTNEYTTINNNRKQFLRDFKHLPEIKLKVDHGLLKSFLLSLLLWANQKIRNYEEFQLSFTEMDGRFHLIFSINSLFIDSQQILELLLFVHPQCSNNVLAILNSMLDYNVLFQFKSLIGYSQVVLSFDMIFEEFVVSNPANEIDSMKDKPNTKKIGVVLTTRQDILELNFEVLVFNSLRDLYDASITGEITHAIIEIDEYPIPEIIFTLTGFFHQIILLINSNIFEQMKDDKTLEDSQNVTVLNSTIEISEFSKIMTFQMKNNVSEYSSPVSSNKEV
eukprot:TRINITY_DN780_c0_g1_i1.p1 TRINITY_DN780_c0_g1~~TRINITY_DN780_c0_g1_i1.p1  ORF type:complete len:999 (+),score=189.64 TRINITY_DN780_c0_g1_i1:122-3118(+)